MTRRPYELLVRFGRDGKVGGASVRTITTIDGRDYESDPQPLSGTGDAEFVAFADQFAASAAAECEALRERVTALEAERDTLTRQVTAAQQQAQQLEAVTAERDQLRLRVPPEPTATQLTRAAFISRLKPAELVGLFRSPEPAAVLAAVTLFTHDGLIDLESETLRQLLAGLVPILGADRVAEIGKAN